MFQISQKALKCFNKTIKFRFILTQCWTNRPKNVLNTIIIVMFFKFIFTTIQCKSGKELNLYVASFL